jgi:hypothetical protein
MTTIEARTALRTAARTALRTAARTVARIGFERGRPWAASRLPSRPIAVADIYPRRGSKS